MDFNNLGSNTGEVLAYVGWNVHRKYIERLRMRYVRMYRYDMHCWDMVHSGHSFCVCVLLCVYVVEKLFFTSQV